MRTRLAGVIGAIVVAGSTNLAGKNWPSFRGGSASGAGTGNPPAAWDLAKGTNVAWKVAIPGLGHSSPIVWENRIFVTTAVTLGGKDAAPVTRPMEAAGAALAADTGEHEWRLYAHQRAT